MTRGTRTVLFILGATLANMLATALIFILILALYGLTLGRFLKLASAAPVILGAFVAALVISSILYKKTLSWARGRWKLDEKLGFGPGAPRKPR